MTDPISRRPGTSSSSLPPVTSRTSSPSLPAVPNPSPSSSWTPRPSGPSTRPAPPPNAAANRISTNALSAVTSLATPTIGSIDPLQALSLVRDGRATLSVPLNPGTYRVSGQNLTVPSSNPPPTISVDVEVRNGRLVPARSANDSAGTHVRINPPLDGPLWTSINGAYLSEGRNRAGITADIGGFFDLQAQRLDSTDLASVVRTLTAPPANGRPAEGLPPGLLNTEALRFDANVTLQDQPLSLGNTAIDLAAGSQVRVSGSLSNVSVEGQARFDSITVNEGTTQSRLSGGSATVRAEYTRLPNGQLRTTGTLSDVTTSLDRYDVSRPAFPQDPDPQRLSLGPARLTNGRLQVDSTFTLPPGQTTPQLVGTPSVRMQGDVEGQINNARLTIQDDDGTADFRITRGGQVRGHVEFGPDAQRIDARVTGTAVEIRDLQVRDGNSRVGVRRAAFEGDLSLRSTTETGRPGSLSMEMNATNLNVELDSARGSTGAGSVDLSHLDVNGGGRVRFSSTDGLSVDAAPGRGINVDAQVRDLRVGDAAAPTIDVAAGSRVTGQLNRLHVGGREGFALDAQGRVDARLDGMSLDVGGVRAQGAGTLQGNARLNINSRETSLTGNLTATSSVAASTTQRLDAPGVRVPAGQTARGDVRVSIGEVRSDAQGRVRYSNVDAVVNATVGNAGTAPLSNLSGAPQGVLTPEQVRGTPASVLANASSTNRPTTIDAIGAAGLVQNGRVQMNIPMTPGDVTMGDTRLRIPPNTRVSVSAAVANGQIDLNNTVVTFEPHITALGTLIGDVTVGSLVVERSGSGLQLRARADGLQGVVAWVAGKDVVRPGLPTDVGGFVRGMMTPQPGSTGNSDELMRHMNLPAATLDVRDATFRPGGQLQVPGGTITLGANTRLSVSGTVASPTISGSVAFSNIDVAQDGVAVRGGAGTANVRFSMQNNVPTEVTMNNLTVQAEAAALRRENGDYLDLARGQMTNASLSLRGTGARQQLTFDIPQFTGEVEGARLSMETAPGQTSTVEVGSGRFSGRLRLSPQAIDAAGTLQNADVRVAGLRAQQGGTQANIESARFRGSGTINASSSAAGSRFELNADVEGFDARLGRTRADAGVTRAQVERSRVQGRGHVTYTARGDLEMTGQLRVQVDDASGTAQLPVVPRQPRG